jgi:hypothetical protein
MSGNISIANLDRVELLKKLWTNMKPAAFFSMNNVPSPSFSEYNAREAVKNYIDYFDGRCIKTDLSKDEIDPWAYDRDAGVGTFKRIVDSMR